MGAEWAPILEEGHAFEWVWVYVTMCECVFVYVRMWMCVWACFYIHEYVCVCACVCLNVSVHMCVCLGSGQQQRVEGADCWCICCRLKRLECFLSSKRQRSSMFVVPLLPTRYVRHVTCNFSNKHMIQVLSSPSYRTKSWSQTDRRWWTWEWNLFHGLIWFGQFFKWQSSGKIWITRECWQESS